MQFNPDLNKQAQESIFSRRSVKLVQSAVKCNDIPVACAKIQKHVSLFLDENLCFSDHIKEKLENAMNGVNVITKFGNVVTSRFVITVTLCNT